MWFDFPRQAHPRIEMGTRTITQLFYGAVGAVAVSACSASPTALSPTQGSFSMPTSSQADTQSQSPTAELLLLRLIDLIKQSKSVRDLTPDRVSAVMQQPVTFFTPDRFGYRGPLTADWRFTLDVRTVNSVTERLDLDFIDRTANRSATATEICQIDFDRFASEMAKAGFSRTTINGEHGTVVYDRFDRPNLSIKVSTRGEAPDPLEKAQHSCVQLVTVQ